MIITLAIGFLLIVYELEQLYEIEEKKDNRLKEIMFDLVELRFDLKHRTGEEKK